ncbi:MAG: tetratricopeptide repeat protein [Bacteroidales bacterium]|nr:tetratricopeptide repeat protein [Bacteroidales bacterium]
MEKNKRNIIILAIVFAITIIVTYSNHFNNGFHLDDICAIPDNIYIRDMKNFTLFFTDMKTFSSNTNDLGYRPVVTASTAIDYWLGGGLKPFWFHMSMFTVFIMQGVLMFFLFLKIVNAENKHNWNNYFVLFAAAWYMIHPGNAETINYIIQRADSFSTFFVILGLVMFIFSKFSRRYFLYLIPVFLGILSKETAVMFPLFLFIYVFLFEKNVGLSDFFGGKNTKAAWSSVKVVLPALLLTLAAAFFVQYISLKQTTNSGFLNNVGGGSNSTYHFQYMITQPYVLLTYFLQYLVPIGLSTDPDITVISSFSDLRLWIGFLFIGGLIYLSFLTSRYKEWRPFAFGILWFIIASIPTSVLAALSQVSNSHRLFFPYVGICLSVSWALYMFVLKIIPVFEEKLFKRVLVFIISLILISNSYATWQRNEVWDNEDNLWKDIVQKNPGNARALMNYGLSCMEKGDFFEAEYYYRKALKLWPNWVYLHINMGILKNAMGQSVEAENWFKSSISVELNGVESYYYYARFLYEKGNKPMAASYLEKAISISSAHIRSRILLMMIYAEQERWDALRSLANSTLQIDSSEPNALRYLKISETGKSETTTLEEELKNKPTEDGYLSLSVMYYQKKDFEKCINACNEVLKINPKSADAYNNIGSACNSMQMWDKGIEACEKALKIKPDFALARNNLNWAKTEKMRMNSK